MASTPSTRHLLDGVEVPVTPSTRRLLDAVEVSIRPPPPGVGQIHAEPPSPLPLADSPTGPVISPPISPPSIPSPTSRGDRPPPRRAAAKAADIVRRATSSLCDDDNTGEASEEDASPTSVATPTGVATPTTVAQFTATLYEILGEDKSEVHCHWSDDGERVVFLDSDAFARDVCPRYFRHSKWTSFARMLNMYEFRKARRRRPLPSRRWRPRGEHDRGAASRQTTTQVSTSPRNARSTRHEFAHEFFTRDRKDLLNRVQRKRRASASERPPRSPRNNQDAQELAIMRRRVQELEGRVGELERENHLLKSRDFTIHDQASSELLAEPMPESPAGLHKFHKPAPPKDPRVAFAANRDASARSSGNSASSSFSLSSLRQLFGGEQPTEQNWWEQMLPNAPPLPETVAARMISTDTVNSSEGGWSTFSALSVNEHDYGDNSPRTPADGRGRVTSRAPVRKRRVG